MIDSSAFQRFKRQESVLALLTLSAVAALVGVHILFEPVLELPSARVLIVLGSFFLVEVLGLAWLRSLRQPLGPRAMRVYSIASVWVTIAFAQLASSLRQTVDSPYPILMVPAVIAAGFRFSLTGLVGVLLVVSALVVYQPWDFDLAQGPIMPGEYFEAATIALIFVLVGLVVWFLAGQLHREELKLTASMEELHRTRDQLVAEEKLAAVGRLSSSIAHEIRNPVGMIASSVAAAQRGELGEADREKLFAIAGAEAARLEKLTDDFLAYARARPPDRQVCAIEPILAYVAGIASARAAELGVTLEVQSPTGLSANLDLFQLQQALLNLVLNAIEAARSGGRVVLGAREEPQGGASRRVALTVLNSGAPIAESAADRIFEPFFTTKRTGTGLGLAISRNIARAHGGDLTLSRNEADGVQFTFWIPAD